MRELSNSEKRFVDVKNAKYHIRYNGISPKFYLSVRNAVLGEKEWERVFGEASFNECIAFLQMNLYDRGNLFFYPITRMIELVSREKGERKFWLLVKAIPFLQRRSSYGGWQYVTPEAREKLVEIYWEIENAPDYPIFLWASDENNHRGCGNIPFINAINLKAQRFSGKKALKIKYLKKEGKKKF